MFGEVVGGNGYSGGEESDWMVRIEEHMTEFGIKFEGCGQRLHRRPADCFDGSRRGRRHSCEKDMTRRAVELQSDT